MSKNLQFVVAEFGEARGWPIHQLAENLTDMVPGSTVNSMAQDVGDVCLKSHPRWGWRMNDYWQIKGLLLNQADIAIAVDADMRIVSPSRFRTIVPLVQKFGMCFAMNPRLTVKAEVQKGADSDRVLDETEGMGIAVCTAFMAFDTHNKAARAFLQEVEKEMRERPRRLPIVIWKAMFSTGFMPCILPPQWCVCDGYEGCDDPVVVHIGHDKVRKFYGF